MDGKHCIPSVIIAMLAAAGLLMPWAGEARADLIVRDLQPGSGQGEVTHDTESGLEWLDLRFTRRKIIEDVKRSKIAYSRIGFRVATEDQVRQLFENAGGQGRFRNIKMAALNLEAATRLLATLGYLKRYGNQRFLTSGYLLQEDGTIIGADVIADPLKKRAKLLIAWWPRSNPRLRQNDMGIFLVRKARKPD